MKKIPFLIIILSVLLSSCFKTEIVPPLIFDGEANMTIAELQQFHELGAQSLPTLIDTAVIISGIVTSTDEFGSCYKEIFFQDETGGVSLRINNTSYYHKYRIGQRIFVKAQGLYLGNYISGSNYGFYQIGLYGNANGGLELISPQKENQHIFRSDVPGAQPIPKIITKYSDIETGVGGDFHTLIKLVNCYFTQAKDGAKYYEERFVIGGAANQPIRFNTGGNEEVVARISSPYYCSFANAILPEGAVNITGILTQFGNTHQFIIRRIEDVEAPKILKVYDMKTDPFAQGWTNKQIAGKDAWAYDATNKNVGVQKPSGNDAECWLVSPKFNFSDEKGVSLCFTNRLLNGTDENAQVLCSVDGTNWNSLEFISQSGMIETVLKLDDNMTTNPNLQIAFKYKTTDKFPTWYITNIAFRTNVY